MQIAIPADAQNVRPRDDSDSPESHKYGETNNPIPREMFRKVEMQRSEMILDFGVLHDGLRDTINTSTRMAVFPLEQFRSFFGSVKVLEWGRLGSTMEISRAVELNRE